MLWIWSQWQAAMAYRPARYGTLLTAVFLVLCTGAFLLVDAIVDHYLKGGTASVLDRVEWESAIPFLAISSLLFFLFSRTMLERIQERTRALERSESERALAEQQALLGVLSASVLHDCNNALQIVMGNLAMLESRAVGLDPESRGYLAYIDDALLQIQRSVALMHDFAVQSPAVQPLALAQVVEDCLALVRRHPSCVGCTVTVRREGEPVVSGEKTPIRNAIINLLLNAADAVGDEGRVEVRVYDGGEHAAVEVHDDGPGIPPHLVPKVLDPQFTTKPDGSGLGLYSVNQCARNHHGRVEIEASPLGGACVRLVLAAERASGERGEPTATR